MWKLNEDLYQSRIEEAIIYTESGKLTKSLGLIFEAHLPGASVGSLCQILPSLSSSSEFWVDAEVIGFRNQKVLLMPYEEIQGMNSDSWVILKKKSSSVQVGNFLLGRILNGRGQPLDGEQFYIKTHDYSEQRSLYHKSVHPLKRNMIEEPLDLGVRAINGLLTCGKGQRIGIMAGSGVGKSVLLGMMAKNTTADVNVIALVGERGREVREFIERDLGAEGLKRSVLIVATSDQSPLIRMRAAFLATTISEYFRDQGKDVLLMMDSVTRFCMAQREIGLSMGELPATKGYTPSVFSSIPKILERSGMNSGKGSITGIYTVLVEGDDMDDPIADSTRAILDGHIVLSRKIAQRNHFPAIDILQSTSRVMRAISGQDQLAWSGKIKDWLSAYREAEDLINIGAYSKGSNPRVDKSILVIDKINQFLRQNIDEKSSFQETLAMMHSIIRAAEPELQ